jgi:hypothetical protein
METFDWKYNLAQRLFVLASLLFVGVAMMA